MHICHDYTAQLVAEANMKDARRRSSNFRLVRELRKRYRRQLILWVCHAARRAGRTLVTWSERVERQRGETFGRTELAPSGGG
jgi:hypothetical protein